MITTFGFQSVTVTAQNEAMSARNAQLEIENESLKNELQNSRADYAALQGDMNDVRDYYHQVDIAASKMGHRCEVSVREEQLSVVCRNHESSTNLALTNQNRPTDFSFNQEPIQTRRSLRYERFPVLDTGLFSRAWHQ